MKRPERAGAIGPADESREGGSGSAARAEASAWVGSGTLRSGAAGSATPAVPAGPATRKRWLQRGQRTLRPTRCAGTLSERAPQLGQTTLIMAPMSVEGPAQRVAELGRGGVARRGIVGDRAIDHRGQRLWQVRGPPPQPHDTPAEDHGQRILVRAEVADILPGQHEIQGRAHAPDVARRTELAEARDLLAGHERKRTGGRSGRGEAREAGRLEALGQAEVG